VAENAFYKTEVLKCVVVPWNRIQQEEGGDGFGEVKSECRTTVQMLRDALSEDGGLEVEVAELIKADVRLEGLFTD